MISFNQLIAFLDAIVPARQKSDNLSLYSRQSKQIMTDSWSKIPVSDISYIGAVVDMRFCAGLANTRVWIWRTANANSALHPFRVGHWVPTKTGE